MTARRHTREPSLGTAVRRWFLRLAQTQRCSSFGADNGAERVPGDIDTSRGSWRLVFDSDCL